MSYSGFYDLNLNINAFKDTHKLFEKLNDFGYRTIAVNHVLEESALDVKTNKKRKSGSGEKGTGGVDSANNNYSNDIVPLPQIVNIPEEYVGKFQLLNRLTVEYSDANQLVKIRQSENLKKYNLLAAVPKTESALQRTCITLDFDIISFNPVDKPVKFNRKMYNLATSKNTCFEIPYSAMLNSSTARKNVIQAAHAYHSIGRSKNVIITSGAEHYMQIRGPYDVINLGLLFGLSSSESKNAITSLSSQVVLKGDGRRCGNAVMMVNKVTSESNTTNDVNLSENTLPAKKRLKK
ncbi:ribonuclease P protein subunit Rpp30 [Lycorma delicatula]|uniref:ribonuclease P protein subunit Rpp30 n=1 Tax=Lycorma delicatula TaxID=130591 RepID=UPI003F5114C5